MKNISKATKWIVSIVLIALGLLAGVVKFGFMYDRGLEAKFVNQKVYDLQVKTLNKDVDDIKKKTNHISVQQQETNRKLDRALILLGDPP
jgi:hypothetical protein